MRNKYIIFGVCLVLLVLVFSKPEQAKAWQRSCQSNWIGGDASSPNLGADPDTGTTNLGVNFNISAQGFGYGVHTGTGPYNYSLDYGDGQVDSGSYDAPFGATLSHTYNSAGTYNVTLSVQNQVQDELGQIVGSDSCTTPAGTMVISVPLQQGCPPNCPIGKPGAFSINTQNVFCGPSGNNTEVDVIWGASSGATGYKVYDNYLGSVTLVADVGAATSYTYYQRKGNYQVQTYVQAYNAQGTTDSNTMSNPACLSPDVTISANPVSVALNGTSTISWTPSNVSPQAAGYLCTASSSPVNGNWNGSKDATAGAHSQSSGALTQTTTFSIFCSDPDGGYPSNTVSATVTVGGGGGPTAPTLNNPDNSKCAKLTLTWTDNSNNETGFHIYRGTSPGGESLLASVGANVTTYPDTPPSTGITYYYKVSAYNGNGEGMSAEKSAMNVTCNASMANSSERIIKINGNNYTTTTGINNGDTLTYQITVVNSGPTNATVNFICVAPSSNVTNLRNLQISGPGASSSGITPNSPSCSGGTKLGISGDHDVANNWLVTYDATVLTASSIVQEVLTNGVQINFTDSAPHWWNGAAPNYIVNSSKGKTPNFREVAP